MKQSIQNVVVLGGGTAGFLSALALRRHLPELNIQVIRSTRLGVIGVGEGTIISVVPFLHQYLGLPSQAFHQQVRPGIKLGIRYLWGKRPFFHYTFSRQLTAGTPGLEFPRGYYCDDEFDFADLSSALMMQDKACLKRIDGRPQFASSFSYHLENEAFVRFLETAADQAGIDKIDDLVQHVQVDEQGVQNLVLESGQRIEGDLFLDCSGFRSMLLGQALDEPVIDFSPALFCNRAVVGGWTRTDEPYHPFTTAETMDAGWCWRIEHDEIINRGYVFSSDFLTDEQAEAEFRKKNPKVETTRVVPFVPQCRQRFWVKNVVAIGNSAGFVEPIEATAIAMICDSISLLVRALKASGCQWVPQQAELFNRVTLKNWEIIRDFLALHHKFNDRLDTPYWKAARADVEVGAAAGLIEYYRQVGPDLGMLAYDLKRDFFSAEGYLAMLVGQQVEYRRTVSLSEAQRTRWRQYKTNLAQRAEKGMGVRECVAALREHGLTPRQGGEQPDADQVNYEMQRTLGELNWH